MIAPRDEKIELKPSPAKRVGFLVIYLAVTAGGTFIVREGPVISLLMGCLGIAFGTLGIIGSFAALIWPRFILRLTPQGFSYGSLRKSYFYNWADIAVFGVSDFGMGKRVCFNFRPHYSGEVKVRAINQGSVGFDRFLHESYGMTPMELATLLEKWRQRYSVADE